MWEVLTNKTEISGCQLIHSLFVKNKLKHSVQYFELERSKIKLQVQWPTILTFLVIFFSIYAKMLG
jgi:hypothetical protein